MDIGVMQTGAQTVPIYPTIAAEDYEYILNHSEASYCFVSDDVVLKKLQSIQKNVPLLKDIFSFDEINGCKNWKEVLALGEDSSNQDVVEDRKNNVKPEELATIIYTSGTVSYTHLDVYKRQEEYRITNGGTFFSLIKLLPQLLKGLS